MARAQEETVDVIVIGSGWSGLLACKHARDEKLTVQVLEKSDHVGGVWKYSPDPNETSVMKNTKMSSSNCVTEMSDFPMPDSIGEFPTHWDVYEYLNNYVDKFKLRTNIKFNCNVTSVEKEGDTWKVLSEGNAVYRSKNIAVCTGPNQKPNRLIENTTLKGFTGEIVHSGNIKEFQEKHRNKRIMVVGGGETASDILDEYYGKTDSIIWCIPHGQHFFRKFAKILPNRKPQALDKASSRVLRWIAPHPRGKPGLSWICKWTSNGSVLAYQGHGIAEFRNNAQFQHSFINKHGHALDYIDYVKVIPKGEISNVSGATVYFKDESNYDVDVIILCTGYQISFPFLPKKYQSFQFLDLYKHIFNVEDPSLSFVGFVRPVVGSIPFMSELQALLLTRVMSGRVELADLYERMKTVKQDREYWQNYFKDTSQRSSLVDAYTYADQISRLCGTYPDFWALCKFKPKYCYTALFSPANLSSTLLNDPEKRDEAIKNLERHNKGTITPLNLILIILLRLFLFDWFCDILGSVKYKIQTNKYWHKIREWRIIHLLDYVWCTPKRLLFDNERRI